MHNILSLIIKAKKNKLPVLKKNREGFLSLIKKSPKPRSFKEAVNISGKISLIGEVKQASPSAGILRKEFDYLQMLKTFKENGIKAVSILTEEEFFLGKLAYITEAKKVIDLPILRKDFILDEIHVLESRAAGADAILLIASILEEEKLQRCYNLAKELGMDVIVEIHTQKDLKKALKVEADIIGINNRNLHTLKVDINNTQKLVPFIPKNRVIISESGINIFKDVLWLKGLEVNAVLIGESLMKAEDIKEKIKELNVDG